MKVWTNLKKRTPIFSVYLLLLMSFACFKVFGFQSEFAPNVEQCLIIPTLTLEQLLLPKISDRGEVYRVKYGYAAGDMVGWHGAGGPIAFGGLYDQKDEATTFRGYRATFGGFGIAADTPICPIGKLGLGISGTFAGIKPGVQSKVGFGNDIDVSSVQLIAYGTAFYRWFFIDGMASSGYNGYTSKRNMPTINTTATATFGGIQTNAELRGGLVISVNRYLDITPMVSVKTVHLRQTQYTEKHGGAGNLTVLGQKTQLSQMAAGARFAEVSEPETFYPEIHVFYIQDKTRPNFQLSAAYTNPAAAIAAGLPFTTAGNLPFTTLGATPASKGLNLGGSITALLREGMILTGGYDAILRTRYVFQYGWLRIHWAY